jgi:hypothetical protein
LFIGAGSPNNPTDAAVVQAVGPIPGLALNNTTEISSIALNIGQPSATLSGYAPAGTPILYYCALCSGGLNTGFITKTFVGVTVQYDPDVIANDQYGDCEFNPPDGYHSNFGAPQQSAPFWLNATGCQNMFVNNSAVIDNITEISMTNAIQPGHSGHGVFTGKNSCHALVGMVFSGILDSPNDGYITNSNADFFALQGDMKTFFGGNPNLQVTNGSGCGGGLSAAYQVQALPMLGFGLSPLVVPGTGDLVDGGAPGPNELPPAVQAAYTNEAKNRPPLTDLVKLSDDPALTISRIALQIDNGAMVWHVGIANWVYGGATASPVFEARIKAALAKFSTLPVVLEPTPLAKAI